MNWRRSTGMLAALGVLAVSVTNAQPVTCPLSGIITYEGSSPMADWKGTNTAITDQVTWDQKTGNLTAEVWVDLAKWNSGNGVRDDHTRVMFETERFPKSCYTVNGVTGDVASGAITLKGKLDLHGTKHDLDIPGTVKIENKKFRFNGDFTTHITDWAMKQSSLLGVQVVDQVKSHIQADGTHK